MTSILVVILLIGFVLIATERVNHINRAAVAMFVGVLCWLLYIGYGASYVEAQHSSEYAAFLRGSASTAGSLKEFIAHSVFMKYVTGACEVVLYILATMTIVEILNSNGCFNFFSPLLLTRSSRKMIWMLAGVTFLISANLDNLTTTCLMLALVQSMVANPRQRMVLGSVVVLAANAGGAFTVIGDVNSLVLWVKGAITPTTYSGMMCVPLFVALSVPVHLLSRMLPERLDLVSGMGRTTWLGQSPLSIAQRLGMGIVGIGGLWFIPTFHRITHLSPFVGALCILSLLWIVNEVANRKLLRAGRMVPRLFPQSLEYANIQNMLFIIGVFLAVGAVKESGGIDAVGAFLHQHVHNVYILGGMMGALSSVLDSTVVVVSNLSIFSVQGSGVTGYLTDFTQNGAFWPFLSFCAAMGSSSLVIGSLAGAALMRMENVSIGWYLRFISGKVVIGWGAGAVAFYLISEYC